MPEAKLLIPHDFNFQKYHPWTTELPYWATGAKLRDELAGRCPELGVTWARTQEETEHEIADADYLVVYHTGRALLDRAQRLRWIQCGGAGIDHFYKLSDFDEPYLKARGIMLSSAAGVTRIVIGEQVLGMMLMLSRGLHRAMRQQVHHHWEIFSADELYGRTVGIIGLGEIGGRVAELAACLGMHVIGTKGNPATYSGPAEEVLAASEYPQVLQRADYVVLACPITEATRGMINEDALALMKPTACLINISRGELVDEAALVEALKTGVIAGAALDTFGPRLPQRTMKDQEALAPDSELWALENVIITPNNASGTPRIYEYLAGIITENHRRIQAGEEPRARNSSESSGFAIVPSFLTDGWSLTGLHRNRTKSRRQPLPRVLLDALSLLDHHALFMRDSVFNDLRIAAYNGPVTPWGLSRSPNST